MKLSTQKLIFAYLQKILEKRKKKKKRDLFGDEYQNLLVTYFSYDVTKYKILWI